MNADQPHADYDVASGPQRGTRITLYANRLVRQGPDAMETVALAQLASVQVAFARVARKLGWALALLFLAAVLAVASGPLQEWAATLAGGVREHAGRESLDAALLATFSALRGLARLFLPAAAVLAAAAAGLLACYWVGSTTMTLAFAATEREIAVRGRNQFLIQFAEAVAARISELRAEPSSARRAG